MGKKKLLIDLISYIIPYSFVLGLRTLFKKELVVLAYHRVCDIKKESYKFDIELVSASRNSFDYQIKHIKKYYNPISMEQLIDSIERKVSLPKRPILITFDDGFDDNYLNAFPILKKYNVPATIFLSTGYIDTNNVIWFDRLASLIFLTDLNTLNISEIGKTYNLGAVKSKRGEIMEIICEDLKLIPNIEREKILNDLYDKYENIEEMDASQSKMLDWNQVKEMNSSIINFGSHTVTHPILSRLTNEELDYELLESKKQIELNLNSPINSISYPNGNESSYNDLVINKAKSFGYKVGFTYIPGNNPLPIKNNFILKRLHIESYTDNNYFRFLLCFPSFLSN